MTEPKQDDGDAPEASIYQRHIRVKGMDGVFFWACARTLRRVHLDARSDAPSHGTMSLASWEIERRVHSIIDKLHDLGERAQAERKKRMAGKLGGNFSKRKRQLRPGAAT